MKKIDLFRLEAGLKAVSAFTGAKWAYAVAKNLRTIGAETELLRGLVPALTEQYTTFEEERIKLCKRWAKKNEAGEPVTVGNAFMIADQAAFDTDLVDLREKHSETIDKRAEQVHGYETLLQEPTDIELHFVNLDEIPEEISAAQLRDIFEIVREPQKNQE